MRATKLINAIQGRSLGVYMGEDFFDGYEKKLTRWGCYNCEFFEKRLFKSGLPAEELDACIICRFAGGLVDLLGDVTVCPKNCRPELHKNEIELGRRRLRCV